jgi:hypothetical protein
MDNLATVLHEKFGSATVIGFVKHRIKYLINYITTAMGEGKRGGD